MSDLNVETIKSDNEKGFLDFSLEVRMMVYDIFFGAPIFPFSQSRTRCREPYARKGDFVVAIAHDKIPLLLTNKDIWAEASPFFYRLHIFRIRLLNHYQFPLPSYNLISAGVRQVLQAIRRIDLAYLLPGRDSAEDATASPYLRLLRKCCHALKSLRVELSHDSCLESTSDASACELQQLWPRLDSLQVCVRHFVNLYEMPQGEYIAPGEQWCQAVCEGYWADSRLPRRTDLKRSVYCAVRHQKAGVIG